MENEKKKYLKGNILITKYFIHKGSITWQDKIIICIVLSE